MKRFLLLHGAGLGSCIWDRVLPQLQTPAKAIDLPGRSDSWDPGDVTLNACVDVIRDEMRGGDARLIIVGHSFSAQIALAAAAADPARVASVVLVGGLVPESGRNFLSLMPLPLRLFMKIVLKRSPHGVSLPKSLVRGEYCNDLDQATTQVVMSRIVREAPRLYSDTVEWASLPASVPRGYVQLPNDKSTSQKMQKQMIERVNATLLESLPTGHLPMLADPAACATALERMARAVA